MPDAGDMIPLSDVAGAVKLGQVFRRTTSSYKFLWFLSILDLVASRDLQIGKALRLSMPEIVALMIAKAWVPTQRFRLNFGHWDKMTQRIEELKSLKIVRLDAADDEHSVIRALNSLKSDQKAKYLEEIYKPLTRYVPQHFLSPWSGSAEKDDANWAPYRRVGHSDEIEISYPWAQYLQENYQVLKGFALWKFAGYLEDRNTNVPGLNQRLEFTGARGSLSVPTEFWRSYLINGKVKTDIYGEPIVESDGSFSFHLEHFLPWHFVMHDQIWNLSPVNSNLNSSKSDRIPQVDQFIRQFALQQQKLLHFHLQREQQEKTEEYFYAQYENFFGCEVSVLTEMPETSLITLFSDRFQPMERTALNMGFERWDRVMATASIGN